MVRKSYPLIVVISLALLIVPAFLVQVPIDAVALEESDLYSGPYVNRIMYNVIGSGSQMVTALQSDNIDLIGDEIDSTYRATLEASENIEVVENLRNGYGRMVINTQKNPLNYTVFRRALAFALDKNMIASDVLNGYANPQDSLVPAINPFSCEGLLGFNYYASNTTYANQLLDQAGFTLDGATGFRKTPNGDAFNILIEVAQSSTVAVDTGEYFEAALTALHVNATSQPTDFYEYLNRLYFHGDFDLAFVGSSFNNFDVDWMAYEYWGDFADTSYYNYPGWANATYDSWRNQLLYSTSYEDVYEAAFEMQKIWVYNCPEIICYESINLYAHRTDNFNGFVNDCIDGVPSWWTNFKTYLKFNEGGPYGGTLRWGNLMDVDSFNIMVTSSRYTLNVLQMLYDSLMILDPNGNPIPWLATDYKVETHADNSSVPTGHTRYTYNLLQNATWSDFTLITAADVAYCLNYYKDAPGNPYGTSLAEMNEAYASTDHQVVVEFSTESYWHISDFAFKPILPMSTLSSIGLSGWNSWNPSYSSLVTSGPFYVSDYSSGEFIELTRNYLYFRMGEYITPPTTLPTTPPTTLPATYTTPPISTTTPSGYVNHHLEYNVELGDRLDFHISGTSTTPGYPSISGSGSESAYFIVESVPTIPDPISHVLEIPPLEGTFYWANGSEWADDSLEILMAIPTGNWSAYTDMWEDLSIYDVSETSTTFSLSYSVSVSNNTISQTRIYSKTTGFLDLYLSEIYADSVKISEFRIQSNSFVSTSVSSTSETTTSSTFPTSSGNLFGSIDTLTILMIAGGAIVAIVVVVVIIRARK